MDRVIDKRALLVALQRGSIRFDDVRTVEPIPKSIEEMAKELRELRDSDPDTFYDRTPVEMVDEIPITHANRAIIVRMLKSGVMTPDDAEALNLGCLKAPFATSLTYAEALDMIERIGFLHD